jgi:N-methylhydantoinase B
VDPITFEILSHRLHQIANEMGTTLERVGGTVNTTQQKDYMAALYRANGEVLSAGNTLGWHVATAGFAVKRIIERFEAAGGIYPDDIFLLNDPYLAAIHQSDVYMISPIHYRDRLVGWSATFVHVMDIGAMSPGGNSPGAREVCQEGLRIPGVKLVEGGMLRQDVFDAFINMTRQPVMVGLDLKCEIAANNVAKNRMQAMCQQYGTELVEAVSSRMIASSETTLRRRVADIPDGEWSDTGMIQSGGETWKIRLTLRKKADQLRFDFGGTDDQAHMGINLPYHGTFGACFAAVLFTLAYDVLKNHGAFRIIEVVAPEGTVVNVKYPGPVSMNTTSAGAIVKYLSSSVLMQMLATSDRWKKEVMALNAGGRTARHAGMNQYGRFYVSGLGSENSVGGTGARSYQDGIDSGGSRMTSPNVEWVERNFPLLYLHRRHVTDGGGPGKYRGGVGSESAFTLHNCPEDKIKVVAMGVAGLRNSGQGVFGGYPGAPGILVHYDNARFADHVAKKGWIRNVAELPVPGKLLPYCEIELKKNDVLYMRTENGGGYGDPLEREPAMVARDVKHGLVSRQAAREVYGVVMNDADGTVDLIESRKLRSQMKEERWS